MSVRSLKTDWGVRLRRGKKAARKHGTDKAAVARRAHADVSLEFAVFLMSK